MRWERLFDDLEAQFDAAERDAMAAEVADRTRREIALVHLIDRWREAIGAEVELSVAGAGAVGGTVSRVGPGWLLLVGVHRDVVVHTDAVHAVRGLPAAAATDPDPRKSVASRLDLGHVLRIVARDRSPVTVILRDGSQDAGTIDRVGADFIDVAEHAIGEPRRADNVSAVRTVALAGVAVVQAG